jgi:hypothetical protein
VGHRRLRPRPTAGSRAQQGSHLITGRDAAEVHQQIAHGRVTAQETQ